jgi:IMP dehydrogenase|tara:strand:+ start:90 stop:1130 length:1041 start_codon:yes stop_codon:yes gene_type:complete
MIEYLTYDDVQILPKYSEVKHRSNCNTSTKITKNIKLDIPIVSSPMDTVTGLDMAYVMGYYGGMGIIHRFMSIEEQSDIINQCDLGKNQYGVEGLQSGAAIGVTGDFIERAQELVLEGCSVLCIDVAHGHHKLVKEAMRRIKNEVNGQVDLLVGNIASKEASRDLCEWGADGLRIGIGGGSLCSTRIQTGVGVPMVSSILSCVAVADEYDVPCMADGGIRNIGDVCKGLGAGADTVMLGSLLSGTKESPGSITKTGVWPNEILQKKYRGSASLESKSDRGESKNVEGYSTTIPYKGKVRRIITDVIDGLKSSMSYVGANNIVEFHSKCEFVKVTNSGINEAKPHLL